MSKETYRYELDQTLDRGRMQRLTEGIKRSRIGKNATKLILSASLTTGVLGVAHASTAGAASDRKPIAHSVESPYDKIVNEQRGQASKVMEEYPSDTLEGAVMISRKGGNSAYQTVVHRLNTGQWMSQPNYSPKMVPRTKVGENSLEPVSFSVDPTPMLKYGFVVSQNGFPIGTPGESSTLQSHDVTPEDAPVYINGVGYDDRMAMQTPDAGSDLSNPFAGSGNLTKGDGITIYLNQPNNKMEKLIYTVTSRQVVSIHDERGRQAAAAYNDSNSKSGINISTCWPQGSSQWREITHADETSSQIVPGQVTIGPAGVPDSVIQPADWSEANL